VIGIVLVVDALSVDVGTVVEVAESNFEVDVDAVIVGQSGQIGRPVIWTVVVDQLFDLLWPRTLGMVPIVAVCTERRVRVTSRRLTKVLFFCSLDFQVMFSQALQVSRTPVYQLYNVSVPEVLTWYGDLSGCMAEWKADPDGAVAGPWRYGRGMRMARLRDDGS